VDGALETIGGVMLLVVPTSAVHNLINQIATADLVADHYAITRSLHALDHSLTAGSIAFVAAYLLVHGLVKLGLVAALFSRRYVLYPYAIVILVGFTIFQIYQLITSYSLGIVGLTVLDVVVVWLTVLEYQRHRHDGLPTP
jgi:uncharacterized membrane protein